MGSRPRPGPSSLYQMQQPTHQRPVYQLHIIRYGTKTAEQRAIIQLYVIGTLAADAWAVAFGTARRGQGGLRSRPVPSSLYQM